METRKKTLTILLVLCLFTFAACASMVHAVGPWIATCSSDGTVKYAFYTNETMYLLGFGFPPSASGPTPQSEGFGNLSLQSLLKDALSMAKALFAGVPSFPSYSFAIYVVTDQDSWTDKMLIPPRIPGTAEQVRTDASGNIQPTAIWYAPLTLGGYDIVVDMNNNGRDVGIDVLQKARIDACPSQHYGVFVLPLPEYWSGTILGLTSFFAALGLFGLVKRRRAARPDHVATCQPQ
jgi:hypothetical protein